MVTPPNQLCFQITQRLRAALYRPADVRRGREVVSCCVCSKTGCLEGCSANKWIPIFHHLGLLIKPGKGRNRTRFLKRGDGLEGSDVARSIMPKRAGHSCLLGTFLMFSGIQARCEHASLLSISKAFSFTRAFSRHFLSLAIWQFTCPTLFSALHGIHKSYTPLFRYSPRFPYSPNSLFCQYPANCLRRLFELYSNLILSLSLSG
ncbi:hypothetical protein BV22DRAFT_582609 [Leucogyrophana mollusca]|uniref:Uncharacterized protein n=1 Tax=Leucogyrophana mollusca TaxID=85980 RepID=A0ACB8BD69_9AGAM|nr:hypothetical protein BV22DRAFT_582609 [Leucogyrophana mollusca]